MSEHTWGPWFEFADQGDTIAIMPAGRQGDVCLFAKPYPSRANARLIAAAPDLLAALSTFLTEYVRLVESGDAGFWDAEKEPKVIAARAAIAKAKGQS